VNGDRIEHILDEELSNLYSLLDGVGKNDSLAEGSEVQQSFKNGKLVLLLERFIELSKGAKIQLSIFHQNFIEVFREEPTLVETFLAEGSTHHDVLDLRTDQFVQEY